MTARSLRITLQNDSEFPMVKNFAHLCWGDWTPGIPEPPDRIEPHGEVTFQAESGGPTSGTEGYVKYNLQTNFVDASGHDMGPEIVYVYWNHPFLLASSEVVGLCATGDIAPGCDYSARSDESTFTRYDNAVFHVVRSIAGSADGADAWEDFLGAGGVTALGMPGLWIFLRNTNELHADHSSVVLRVTTRATTHPAATIPQFLPTESSVFAPVAGQPASFWSGDWELARPDDAERIIKVSISESMKGLGVSMDDRSSLVPFTPLLSGVRPFSGFGSPYLQPTWPSLNGLRQWIPPHEPTQLARLIAPATGQAVQLHVSGSPSPRHLPVAVMHTLPVDRVPLTSTCALEMYGEFVGGRMVSPWLRYLNWDSRTHGATDVLLKRKPRIH